MNNTMQSLKEIQQVVLVPEIDEEIEEPTINDLILVKLDHSKLLAQEVSNELAQLLEPGDEDDEDDEDLQTINENLDKAYENMPRQHQYDDTFYWLKQTDTNENLDKAYENMPRQHQFDDAMHWLRKEHHDNTINILLLKLEHSKLLAKEVLVILTRLIKEAYDAAEEDGNES